MAVTDVARGERVEFLGLRVIYEQRRIWRFQVSLSEIAVFQLESAPTGVRHRQPGPTGTDWAKIVDTSWLPVPT